ncbi:MAG TPA: hypothetical protein VKR30_10780 [Candidatus Limnocylindrales bacterium]|nr:hypothetical protein [Candidatus Limnocylindrales bacterium]
MTRRRDGWGAERTTALAIAGSLALALGSLAGGGAPASAATPALTLVTAATYDVVPAAHKVHVTVLVTATNHMTNTITKSYYFQTAYLSVLPGTKGFRLTSPGIHPSVSVSAHNATDTLLKLGFGTRLGAGKSLALTLVFDLPDPGGAPDRPVRISPSIVSFSAWAFATAATPGSSVTVRFPAGYNVTVGRGPLAGPSTDSAGRQVWTSGALASPLTFIADLSADLPGDYQHTTITATIGSATAEVDLRSWSDDPAWRDRVGGLLRQGLPVLGADIGLAWPIDGQLAVQEALVRNTGGYAGLFDPQTQEVQISYTASSGVVLHEAAHAWFNGRLVADRWAAEAFASYYASLAATQLKLKITNPTLTNGLRAVAFPLNAWGPVGSDSATAESYGYAASFAFAQAVAQRAGQAGLQAVWAKAAAGDGAYQPPNGASEPTGQPPDWRSLLDLFEDTTGQSYDDLWRTWIARPEDLALLDERATARAAYAKLVSDAGSWSLPRSIRDAMRAWQFDTAMAQIAAAEQVLAQRSTLQGAAAAAGISLPPTLEQAFEGAGGLDAAAAEASAEQATLQAISDSAASDPGRSGSQAPILVAVGMVGVDPAGELAASKAAFAQGNLAAAITQASAAAGDWAGAADRGRGRLISLGLAALAVILVWRMTMLHRWRRRSGWTPIE